MHHIAVRATSPLIEAGLLSALAGEPDFKVTATIFASDEAVDVLVADVNDDDEAVARDLYRQLAVDGAKGLVVLGDHLGALAREAAAGRRPLGLLPRHTSPQELIGVVRCVLDGRHAWHVPPDGLVELAGAPRERSQEAASEPLTHRELEVFDLVAKGLSNRDIASVLGISAHTAKFHVGQILSKLGAATRAEAVGAGLRSGWIGV